MAIGAKTWDIRLQFIMEALSFLDRRFIGIIVGFSSSEVISLVAGWRTIVSVPAALLAFAFSVWSVSFRFYPAYKASLLNP